MPARTAATTAAPTAARRYRVLSAVARPALWLWVAAVALSIVRGRAGDGVPSGWRAASIFIAQRFGHRGVRHAVAASGPVATDAGATGRHWLHAASVGEIITALPLMQALDERDRALLVTTATPTGAAVLAARGPHRVQHRFLPIDTPGAVARFLDRERPASGWIVETELWPNLYAAAARRQIPLTILNARLSARTLRGAARGLQPVYACALNGVRVLARSEADAERFCTLGAAPASISVPGDLKRAWSPPTRDSQQNASADDTADGPFDGPPATLHGRAYALAASTHDDEELALATAWRALPGDELLVIVPRHPARADAIEHSLLAGQPRGARLARHGRGETAMPEQRLLLGDTVGELDRWYRSAACAFIGGSLVPRGGHNLLEAARHGLPICTGPHTGNFSDTVDELLEADALQVLDTPQAVARWLLECLRNDGGTAHGEPRGAVCDPAGERARAVALRDADTVQRYLAALLG